MTGTVWLFGKVRNGLFIYAIVAMVFSLLATPQSINAQQAAAPPAPTDVEAVAKWLKANAMPLKSVQAGTGFDDLQPLKKVLKDVRVVGLGEATHGTREFFQFKHRMLEFLVKEMGFTVFAIEASYPGCLSINDYVLYGKGDHATVRQGLGFLVWHTEEVFGMIDWLREYNKAVPEAKRVKFLGYDMQDLKNSYGRVAAYLQKVAPEYLEKIDPEFAPMAKMYQPQLQARSKEETENTRAKIRELIEFLTAGKARFVQTTSAREYEETLQCARVFNQVFDVFAPVPGQQNVTDDRDYFMAKNIEYIMNSEGPNTKVVVWAHNAHVSLDRWRNNFPAMGRHLRQMYGNAYYAMGFTFNQGGFQATDMDPDAAQTQGMSEFFIGPAKEGTVEWYFARAGIKDYMVDFRLSAKLPEVVAWLAAPRPMRSVGAGFSKKWPERNMYWSAAVIKDSFDGMLFIDTTTRARPNATGVRK